MTKAEIKTALRKSLLNYLDNKVKKEKEKIFGISRFLHNCNCDKCWKCEENEVTEAYIVEILDELDMWQQGLKVQRVSALKEILADEGFYARLAKGMIAQFDLDTKGDVRMDEAAIVFSQIETYGLNRGFYPGFRDQIDFNEFFAKHSSDITELLEELSFSTGDEIIDMINSFLCIVREKIKISLTDFLYVYETKNDTSKDEFKHQMLRKALCLVAIEYTANYVTDRLEEYRENDDNR